MPRPSKLELEALLAARLSNRAHFNRLSSIKAKHAEYVRNYNKRMKPAQYADYLARRKRSRDRRKSL